MKPMERRRDARRTVELHATVYLSGDGDPIDCVVKNASGTGCHIVSPALFRLQGDFVKMRIAGFTESTNARVVWREEDRAGVEFVR